MVTLSAAVAYHAAGTGSGRALTYGDREVSYAELADDVAHLAGMMQARGIKPGDVVALLMKNSLAFVELTLALGHVGAVLLPINYRLAPEEIAYILNHAGARRVFVDDELADALPRDVESMRVDDEAQRDPRRLAGDATPLRAPVERQPNDLFRLMYTSGTTDRPKGVMHTYGNFYWKCLDHIISLGLTRDDRLLVVGPLYHVGAFDLPGLALLLVGGSLSILRDFDPTAVLHTISRERLTGGWMAPVMLNRLLRCEERARFDLSSFRWLVGGGERTPEERIREFASLFPGGRYIDAYGLTETCSGDTMMDAGRELEKIGSTGRALAHVCIDIRDDAGQPVPVGSQGEICVRGPKVTPGYWRDDAKTAASFFDGGWLRTGDVGYLDADGYLYLTDRLKDMIISGGENIASSEVERVLYQLPEVLEAAVIGLPDARWGERVVATVVLRAGAHLSEAQILAHARAQLAGFKAPKQVVLCTELPRNPSGKVLKRLLREQLEAVHPEQDSAAKG